MDRYEEILKFWFGHVEQTIVPSETRARIWFGDSPEVDNDIKQKFSQDLDHAIQGHHVEWEKHPRGQLALIIMLDQFSRHIFRDTPQAFGQDDYALSICVQGMSKDEDHHLSLIERVFYYLLLQWTVKLPPLSFCTQTEKIVHSFKLIFSDARLGYFTIASILCYMGFSQLETLFAYLVYHYLGTSHVFVVMYAINGITIIALQVPLTHYARRFEIHHIMMVGFILLAVGLMGVAGSTVYPVCYYLSAFVFTLGEIFTTSLAGVYIDRLAPPDLRYAYFSTSNYGLIGRVAGPPLATLFCHYLGINDGLIIMAIVTLSGIPFLFLAKKASITREIHTPHPVLPPRRNGGKEPSGLQLALTKKHDP